jgi:putative endonuclease
VHTKQLGRLGERIAEAFLEIKGFQVVERNFRYAGREIDLIVRKGRLLAAVEVKLRRTDRFGTAVVAVDGKKLERIRVALQGYLSGTPEPLVPRLDLVVIDFTDPGGDMQVSHLEGVC